MEGDLFCAILFNASTNVFRPSLIFFHYDSLSPEKSIRRNKMKRIMVLAMLCMALIYGSSGIFSASANGVMSGVELPWRVEPIDQYFSTGGISAGFDGWTG
jgi:hypothetical protein